MKRVLVTGARAPAALEIIRRLRTAGYEVYTADSLRFPLSRFSSHINEYLFFPSPRLDFKGFKICLINFVINKKIDFIFPICEEVFYLSFIKEELGKYCTVFCDDFETLSKLHNKYEFQNVAKENGMSGIETFIYLSPQDEMPKISIERKYVAKPIYSRFGDKAFLNLNSYEIKNKLSGNNFPWAVQEYIQGEEFCAYAICKNGRIIAQCCYKPYFKAGQGSSIYFKKIDKPEIFKQVRDFVTSLNYTGQIAFDFIEDSSAKIHVLECNPRATSGVHLLEEVNFDILILDKTPKNVGTKKIETPRDKMIALAMLLFGLRFPNKQGITEFIKSYHKADDVLYDKKDFMPYIGQFIALLELLWRSFKTKKSLKDSSTQDIEWDGQRIE